MGPTAREEGMGDVAMATHHQHPKGPLFVGQGSLEDRAGGWGG